MICPTGFTEHTFANGSACVDALGDTPENYVIQHDIAINRCKGDIPMFLGLGVAALFIPGYFKLIPLVALGLYAGLAEFGGPGCTYLLKGK